MPEMKAIFTEGDDSTTLLIEWWKSLERHRGERGDLRRAVSVAEATFCPSFHRLLHQLRSHGYIIADRNAGAIAAIAGLAAHVKAHNGASTLAQQMARPRKQGGGARVSGLRFRKLVAISERDELYLQLVRVIRLLDGDVNLISLANAAFWWNERTRKYWAYEYYAAAPTEL